MLPLYTPLVVDEYMRCELHKLKPHPFAIARQAYSSMLNDLCSQSILISGDSGAGKTETTKLCLSFLSEIAGSPTGVEKKILSANPLLEAFGNAKTLRNNNSSRFGKFMELHFDMKGGVMSCGTINYLLEKSRVHSQAADERSYHIFYQLCCASVQQKKIQASKRHSLLPSFAHRKSLMVLGNEDIKEDRVDVSMLCLAESDKFRFLSRSGCVTIPGINDAEQFYETEISAINLGINKTEMFNLFSVCAIVLHLGNESFGSTLGSSEGCYVHDSDESISGLIHAARLLELDYEEISLRLRTREFVVRGEVNSVQLTSQQASEARDALCKALYKNAFDWLVHRCNSAMAAKVTPTLNTKDEFKTSLQDLRIGILDIFGFEIFELNGFEQVWAK
jgi:myosin heavy subunit